MQTGTVHSVAKSNTHTFHKFSCEELELITGLGVAGDAHRGETVKHRSRVAKDPTQPNLRQVHLLQSELFSELAEKGFEVQPGEMGENITTTGVDLLKLPTGTILRIGHETQVEITGLRNPCKQIDDFQQGLLKEVAFKDEEGKLVRRAGVMGIVRKGGPVKLGDNIEVLLPSPPFRPLERV